MGGNATVKNKVTGAETLAQKIPLKTIGRKTFITKFISIFEEIDKRFEKKYGRPLWENKTILKNGLVFNGSTSFIMNPEIPDNEIIPFKSESGDIDIVVKESDKEDLWNLLDTLEKNPNILKDVEYKGSNKLSLSSIGDQINCVFSVKFGDIVSMSQVDWEFAKFNEAGEPTEFSRFGHSSDLKDAQNGFKGVNHKFILRALAGGASLRSDILILTGKGTYEKPKFKKTKGKHITELRMNKFFISRGLRKAYEAQFIPGTAEPWIQDGKRVYKEKAASDSTYETSIKEIYKILFNDLDSNDINKMWSFTGIVDLMKKYLSKDSVNDTFKRLLDIHWGPASQKLERDSKDIDFKVKVSATNYLIKKFPNLKKFDDKIEKMTKIFYDNYESKKLTESELQIDDFRNFLRNEF